jgi:phosphatidyl-myo-inositol dimannoside synthase
MRFPVLCTIDQRPGKGGIARVSLLLWKVMQARFPDRCRCVTLLPTGGSARWRHKISFMSTIVGGQLARDTDWLLFDHLGPAMTQLLVPKPFRRPYAVFLHSVEVWNPIGPSKLRTLRGAAVRLANSGYTAQRIRAAHGDVGPIAVCPLTLLPDSLAPAPASDGFDTGLLRRIAPHSALIVGRVLSTERHKGHMQLIETWPEVVKQVPGAQLVIVGEGNDFEFLRAKARELGCADRILFAGWVSEQTLAAIYDRVAAYTMPSDGEGFGLVFLEAMKHRLPCIASGVDASREIVVDGATGFLVNQSDRATLVERVVALLSDPDLRRKMGNAGFRRFQEHFSFEQFEKRVVTALEPLLEAAAVDYKEGMLK